MDLRNRSICHLLLATSLSFSLLAVPGKAQETTKLKTQTKKTEAAASQGESQKEKSDDVRRREEWFYRQRRFPLDHIPGGARQKALERKEEMRREQRAAGANRAAAPAEGTAAAARGSAAGPAPLALSTTTWTHVGPMPAVSADSGVGLVSGRVSAIAVDPTNANIVYVGGAQGGVWKSMDGGMTWATTFDQNKSLAIGAIAIDPSNPNTIYVGTGEQNFSGDSYYGAGIYKSIDGGASWTQIPGETIMNPQPGAPNSFLPPAAPFNQIVGGVHISSMAVSPANSMRIFAGVQIFINFDGGASSGLYCSDNGGQSWTQVLHGAVGTDIQIHPAVIGGNAGSVGYAALGSLNGDTSAADPTGQNGVFKSTNANAACASQTWTLVSKAPMPTLTAAGVIHLGVALSDAAANTVYAAVSQPITNANMSDNLLGVFKTTNGGTTWTMTTQPPDFCVSQCSYDMVVKVHPNSANTVFLGGSREFVGPTPNWLLVSNDGGTTWNPIAQDSAGNALHVDQHALAFGLTAGAATKMYVGNDGGISSTALPALPMPITSTSVAWSNLNNGLEMIQFYPGVSIDPTNNQVTYAGSQDNGTIKMDTAANPGNPLQWNELISPPPGGPGPVCGDGGYTAVDPSSTITVYVACENIDIEKSTNSGATFTEIDTNGITSTDRSEFIPPLVLDAANPQRLYFGTFRVWQTMNGGGSNGTGWSAISPDLTSGPANQDDITSLSISPKNSNVVYVGTFGSGTSSTILQRTTQASLGTGALNTWTRIDANTLPPRAITQVAADPNNQDVVFVTVSGFKGFLAGNTQGHVFRCSAVAPIGCTDISSNLPNIPVNAIVVDPIDPTSNTIYIGTDVGVFGTTTGGASWIVDYPGTTIPNGLPNVAVLGMALHTGSRVLRVVTHGRSAWDLQLAGLPAYAISSITPSTAAAGTPGPFSLTVNGTGFSATSNVLFNNVVHMAVTQTATQLTVNLTTADLAAPGTFNVQVQDAAQPPPGTTNTEPFNVTTPVPVVTNSAPSSTPVNTAVTLVITGQNFITSSQVRINNNGGAISDTFPPPPLSITNNGTTITVNVPATAQSISNPATYFISVFNPPPGGGDSSGGVQVPPNLTVTTTAPPPANDNINSAIVCSGSGTCDTTNNVNATVNTGGVVDPTPSCTVGSPGLAGNGNANSIWYKFTATGPGTIEADTINSLDDTILDVFTGMPGSLTEVSGGCNDDINPGVVRTSQVNFTAVQGTTYFFMVSSFQGFGGKIIFNLNASLLPPQDFTITANPSSATVTRGNSASTTLSIAPTMAQFPGDVKFACTGLPSESSCIFSPSMVFQASSATNVSLTITTRAPSSLIPGPRRGPGGEPFGLALWTLAALALSLLLAARRRARTWRYALSFVLIAIFAGLAVACGGGGGGGVVHDPGSLPLGANSVMVTATSGNMTHTIPFTVTLQ